MSQLTFVTALIDLEEPERQRNGNKGLVEYLQYFLKLIEGVPSMHIILFISETLETEFWSVFSSKLQRLTVIPVNFKNTWTWGTFYPHKDIVKLPDVRTVNHDTTNFLLVQNSKLEWIHEAISLNPYNSKYFAWIDFGIVHVFKDPTGTFDFIENMCTRTIENTRMGSSPGENTKKQCLILPGCWEIPLAHAEEIYKRIWWRFCGGFLIGDITSLELFFDLYQKFFSMTLALRGRLTWEVNLWALIENTKRLHIDWYKADHNDSIVKIPHGLL